MADTGDCLCAKGKGGKLSPYNFYIVVYENVVNVHVIFEHRSFEKCDANRLCLLNDDLCCWLKR